MDLLTGGNQEGLEALIIRTLEQQGRNGEKQRLGVSLSEIGEALEARREASAHAWASDFCKRYSLTAFLMGGDRMYFSPITDDC
jgi:hypothetical protein